MISLYTWANVGTPEPTRLSAKISAMDDKIVSSMFLPSPVTKSSTPPPFPHSGPQFDAVDRLYMVLEVVQVATIAPSCWGASPPALTPCRVK